MEKRKWLWKRKQSDKSPGETESSESISSHSEKNADDQEAQKASPNHEIHSPEVTSKAAPNSEQVDNRVKNLTEKLSAALVNVSAKDDLVKQHSKVAEEAVAGWEKAENEVVVVKQQLEASNQKNLVLEDRLSHLDSALKECVRQLRQAKEDQEQKINEEIKKKVEDWEITKSDLETQVMELQIQLKASETESPANNNSEIYHKLDLLERENSALKQNLYSRYEELEFRTMERDLSTQAAETASKQHLESIKKIAKLEAECRRLKSVMCKSSSFQDQKSVAASASSIYVESLTDSQSDSGERLNALEIGPSCSGSWASALIVELDQFKHEKKDIRNLTASVGDLDIMDDFLEMERLAALPQNETKNRCLELEAISSQSVSGVNSLKLELEAIRRHTIELEEKLSKMEASKAEFEDKLHIMETQKSELEDKLYQMETEKSDLEDKLHIMETQKCELVDKLYQMETEKSDLEEKLHIMEADKADLEKKLQIIEAMKSDLEEKLKVIEAEKCELEMNLTESQDYSKLSKTKLNKAEMMLSEMEKEFHKANEKKQVLESQLVGVEVEARAMCAKVVSLEKEVQKQRALSSKMAIKYRELEDELSRKKQEAEIKETACSNGELKIKQEDLVVAAGKLAECQQTIASLGKQLKSLATLDDFLIDTNLMEFSEGGGSIVASAGGEVWRLHSNDTFLAKKIPNLVIKTGNSPPLLSSSVPSFSNHVGSEKSLNGFVKLFSRSKSGIQHDNQ